MSATATALAGWVAQTPLIDGVLFGSSDGEMEGPPVCAVAVAGTLRGYGKGRTQSQALASAVGEVLELLAASQAVGPQRLLCAPFAEIAAHAFDPRWLGLYQPHQYCRSGFPFHPFRAEQPLHWIEGRWLDSGELVYLPAFAVYLGDAFADEALCQVTSSGLAAGPSLEEAVEHAILELYERDAFLLSWLALLPKLRVAAHGSEILRHLRSRGADTDLYLIAQSPSHAVAVAVGMGDGEQWPAFTLGLGAARNAEDAVDKAILELGQTAPFLRRQWRAGEVPLPASPQDIQLFRDHALYYCDALHWAEFEPWRRTPQGLPNVDDSDVRIAVVDLTPPALAASPYRVARALARGLQPVYCGYGFERLACQRLADLLAGRAANAAPVPIC